MFPKEIYERSFLILLQVGLGKSPYIQMYSIIDTIVWFS